MMRSLYLLGFAAACTYLGYKTLSVYLSLNNGNIGFRLLEPMDWMLYILLIGCFGFAGQAIMHVFQKRRSA